jgi:NADH:ubiquinone oxidoreductase subunit 3 (subunit A)
MSLSMTYVIVLILVVWALVALVFGLALARVLGGISHQAKAPGRQTSDEDDRLARSA